MLLVVNETSPTEMKGPLGALTQILITVGIMISFFLGIPIPDIKQYIDGKYYPDGSIPGFFINRSFESDNYWRIMFSLPIAFSLIQILLLLTVFNYDTPKFLK